MLRSLLTWTIDITHQESPGNRAFVSGTMQELDKSSGILSLKKHLGFSKRDVSSAKIVPALPGVRWDNANVDLPTAGPSTVALARPVGRLLVRGRQPHRPGSEPSQPASTRQMEYSA